MRSLLLRSLSVAGRHGLNFRGQNTSPILKSPSGWFVGHGIEYGPRKSVAMSLDDAKRPASEVQELREALKMLYDLLEDYAPPWYTEEYHDKAEAALRIVKSDENEN